VQRLRAALASVLPANVRVVIILAPRVDIEFVYRPEDDIGETYEDVYPHLEYYLGLDDQTAASMPDILILRATLLDHLSADPDELETLRKRTYRPPLD
jgi:hypothetical protein